MALHDDYAQTKRQGFLDKIEGLLEEFKLWRTRAEDAGDFFARHHSQIRRTTSLLEPACTDLANRIRTSQTFQPDTAFQWSTQLTGLHRLWDFFRVKLAQRDVPHLRPYLRAADDLAWSLYLELRQQTDLTVLPAEHGKEPPLVFLDGAFSPFTQERGLKYLAEELAITEFLPEEMLPLLNLLPVPVIGLPWQHLAHLPDTLVLAHELGHVIEVDFGLGPELDQAMRTAIDDLASTEHQKLWRYWRREIFADLFGVLTLGPAFSARLLDFLSTCTANVAGQRQGHGWYDAHPTTYIRALLALESLTQLGFTKAAQEQRTAWLKSYPEHAMASLEHHIPKVIRGLLNQPLTAFGAKPLADLELFETENQRRVERLAPMLLARVRLTTSDPVDLFAACQLAFGTKPKDYRVKMVDQRVLDHFPKAAKPRSLNHHTRSAQAWTRQEHVDRAVGTGLLSQINQAVRERPISTPGQSNETP